MMSVTLLASRIPSHSPPPRGERRVAGTQSSPPRPAHPSACRISPQRDAGKPERPRLGVYAFLIPLSLVALLFVACGSETDFADPQNPVSQIAWPDFERLHYDMFDQTDTLLGTLILETVREADRYRLSLAFDLNSEDGRVTDTVTVWVDAETLRPIRYEREAQSPKESLSATADYQVDGEGEVTADVVIDEDDEDGEIIEERVAAGRFAFDNDSSAWLWRSLAFRQDLELTYRSVNVLQRRSQLVQVAVRGQDTLRGPEGDVVVWQLVATPGVEISRAWYEIEPPHRLIRWDQQPRRFILTKIESGP